MGATPPSSRWREVARVREDDTIEVLESHDTNCGRYKAPLFIKRTRLPKVK